MSFVGDLQVRLDGGVTSTPLDPARRIGWGIISTGHIAGVFAQDLSLLPDEARLVAVASRTQAKADSFATEFGFERAYDSVAALAADPDIDVVYVASIHPDHFGSAKTCLEADKSVLVEKPLTVSPDETDELIEIARSRGLFLMEALWSRTNPLLRKAAEVVAAGEIGDIVHVSACFGFRFEAEPTHRLLDPAQAGGAILDLGIYPVHMTNLFLGEPSALAGFGRNAATGVDAHAAALLTFDATADRPAATATIQCSMETNFPPRLEVHGSAGSITFDNFIQPARMDVVRSSDDETGPQEPGPRDDVPQEYLTQWPGSGYTFQAQEVMRCLRSGELESPLVPWESTAACARVLAQWAEAVADAVDDAAFDSAPAAPEFPKEV